MTWFLRLNVINGPLPLTIWGLTIVGIIVLLLRRPTPAWMWRIVGAVAVGVVAGIGIVMWVNGSNVFGAPLPFTVGFWAPAGFATILFAIVSLWERGTWRKIVAAVLVLLAVLSTVLGVNAAFGINTTVGSVIGVSTEDKADGLPKPAPTETARGPLYKTWTPPANMPAKGEVKRLSGEFAIPSTGGFVPRDPAIYLPPAALVPNAPRLPFVVMMMGYTGSPDPTFIANALDPLAQKNKGLAPIVIVADQLGYGGDQVGGPDPTCVDSKKYGDVPAYINDDVTAYAVKNLNISLDHKDWTIMGYSNGGACAFTWATHHPDIWGNVIGISPDEYPGVEWRGEAINLLYDGSEAAFEANMPAAGIAAHPGAFAGHLAVFTVGGADPAFAPGVERNAKLAEDAGFSTTYYVVPGAEHVTGSLEGGIPFAMDLLYKHLGLSAP